MSELHIMVGIPGSGKSTIAKNLLRDKWVDILVCPDSVRENMIRKMNLGGDPYFNVSIEPKVWEFVNGSVKGSIENNLIPLIDATNLTVKARKNWFQYADSFVAHYVPTPIGECMSRNSLRTRKVPFDVMERFHQQSLNVTEKVLKDEGWRVICY